ncbi:hypothetical protein Syun_015091 [Stephania yunnanensis]|uniref:Uncharacterized protein n=1 Tax=Stephania yunnanensis TaxID=152371 RepID=A0AAP0PCH9_9MAGN
MAIGVDLEAEQGDEISLEYSGTSSLKRDLVRYLLTMWIVSTMHILTSFKNSKDCDYEGGDGEATNSGGGVDHLAYGEGDIEVFSVPDWAWAMTPRPLMMGRTTLYWMAESFSNPPSPSPPPKNCSTNALPIPLLPSLGPGVARVGVVTGAEREVENGGGASSAMVAARDARRSRGSSDNTDAEDMTVLVAVVYPRSSELDPLILA